MNSARPCAEATGEWSWATCESDYEEIARAAGRCCSDGASYCPAPQLCMDPAAFDPSAQYEYHCTQIGLPEGDCPQGCHFYHHYDAYSNYSVCSCSASDYDSCEALLPGALDA